MRLRAVLTTLLLLLLGVLLWTWFPELETLVGAIEWMRDAGPIGDLAFAMFFGIGTLLLFPASWNTGAARFLYGPFWGALITSLYSTVFAAIAFLLGRTVLRHRVERRLAKYPQVLAIDRAIAKRGLPMVILIRLSPVSPFNPVNYALSATRVSFRDFVLGTWIGGLLPALVWSRVGATLVDLTTLLSGDAGPGWLPAAGLAFTFGLSVPITLLARSAFREAIALESGK